MTSKTTQDFKGHGPFALAALKIDNNDHNGALVSIAEYFGLTSYENVFRAIQAIHMEENEMSPELASIRRRWTFNLSTIVKQKADKDELVYLRGLI